MHAYTARPAARLAAAAIVLLAALFFGAAPAAAQAPSAVRPVTDWVSAQGTYCIQQPDGSCRLFVPPLPNFFGWNDPATPRGASVDYAGIAAAYLQTKGIDLGTTFSGKITEAPMRDGRVRVEVVLHTRNALTWVIEGYTYASNPLLFGWRPFDVEAGQQPELCDSTLIVKFYNPAPGAPMPDLFQLYRAPLQGQAPISIAFTCNASGTMVMPDGSRAPARMMVRQSGLDNAQAKGDNWDGWPVEFVKIMPTGGNAGGSDGGDAGGAGGAGAAAHGVYLPLVGLQ